jgi:hypothetical protein
MKTHIRCDTLFTADWDRVLMIHFEVDAEALQRETPFALDLREGRAFVTLVAFTLRGMRLRRGGLLGRWLVAPIATHEFLNVRTYVRHGGEAGIQFLAEWLPNRLACWLGPRVFSLPYRHGNLRYIHDHELGNLHGEIRDTRTGCRFCYRAACARDAAWQPCAAGGLDEWLMERYTAFNCVAGRARFFRVAHAPWPQARVEVSIEDDALPVSEWPWFRRARCMGANYSPGLRGVGMGSPQRCRVTAPADKR